MSDDSQPPTAITCDSFDAGLARAMGDVPVPVGLVARLQAAVPALPTQPAGDTEPQTVGTRVRLSAKVRWHRRLLLTGCATTALLATWTWLAPRERVVSEADVRRLAGLVASSLSTAPAETRCAMPSGWQSVRGLELAERLVIAPGDTLTVRMLPLTYQADRRSPRVTGLLLPLHETGWPSPVALSPFSTAEVRYTTSGTWVVWREGTTVFVLMLHGDAPIMERLQQAAANRPSVT